MDGRWQGVVGGVGGGAGGWWCSLMAQIVKNLPAMKDTRVQSLGWEDSLEEGMATHSIILAWRIPMKEDPGKLQSMDTAE